MSRGRTPDGLQLWTDARKRHRLSPEQVQMARELGLNPKKLGKLDNHRQEPWKLPLPALIEQLYRKRFGKDRPDVVLSLEDVRKEENGRALHLNAATTINFKQLPRGFIVQDMLRGLFRKAAAPFHVTQLNQKPGHNSLIIACSPNVNYTLKGAEANRQARPRGGPAVQGAQSGRTLAAQDRDAGCSRRR